MSLITVLLLAVALSIDACVVSFAHGIITSKSKVKSALLLASFTGFFQGAMPVIGYYATQSIHTYVEPVSKWIIFGIFCYLGIKFIQEAFEEDKCIDLSLSLKYLFLVAIATSIDALAAGVSLSLTNTKLLMPIILISAVTFVNSIFGFCVGNYLKKFPTKNLEIFAGLILIFLALKSLF